MTCYGSVLKDYKKVMDKSKIYPYMSYEFVKKGADKIPETFDGRSVWYDFMMTPEDNRNISSWAIVARDILNDRFCLSTSGQIIFNLDFYEMLCLINNEPYKKENGIYSTYGIKEDNSTSGYSIFDAWEYMYKYGVYKIECFSEENLITKNLEFPDKISYQKKIELYKNLDARNSFSCLEKFNNKPLAKRIFFPNAIYNVDVESGDINELINSIKYQIAKWGPVAAGFIVYENFNNYDGLDIYKKVEGNPIGSHYVSIVGWGKDYWICRNSFGPDWGLLGYFKIRMNIPECRLEYNVSCVFPYIYDFKIEYDEIEKDDGVLYKNKEVVTLSDMKKINPEIYKIRLEQKINYDLFYSDETIKLIKEGKLYGDLNSLIVYPEQLPHPKLYWLMDLDSYDFVTIDKNKKRNGNHNDNDNNDIIFMLLYIISFYLGYKSKN